MGVGFYLPTMDDGVDDGIDNGWINSAVRRLVSGVLQHFDILPRHVGIVMDGNRRYARQRGYSRKDGHANGFNSMSRLLAVAYAARIREITVYAFSIENFHRSPEEVSDLMNIARSRLTDLIAHRGIAQQYGVRINIMGRIDMLPEDVQELANKIMDTTKHNHQAILNLAMPYTARDDMANAVAQVASDVASNGSNKNNNEFENSAQFAQMEPQLATQTISKAMHTGDSQPLDLLIRTSDTHRLSDFLLWELNDNTVVDFVSELWPEYTPITFLRSVLRWRSQVHAQRKQEPEH